jgi:outer membrane protein assembly factor BamB
VNAGTGAANWAHQVAEDLASVPVIANGVIYVSSDSGLLQALAAAGASKLWTAPASAEGASPAVAAGQVYVCDNEKLQSLDARTGRPGWSFTPPSLASGTPAVANGLVFFGCGDNNLYAIRA